MVEVAHGHVSPGMGRPAFGCGCHSASLKPSHCPPRPPAGPAPATHDHSGPQRWRNGGIPKWTRICTLLLETGGMRAPGPLLGPAPTPDTAGMQPRAEAGRPGPHRTWAAPVCPPQRHQGAGDPSAHPPGHSQLCMRGQNTPPPPALQTRSGALCQPGGLLMSLIPSTCPRPQPRDAHG